MKRRFTPKQSNCKIDINNYLTIEALEDELTVSLSNFDLTFKCEYCIDGNDDWKILYTDSIIPTINSGHTLSFRGYLNPNYLYGKEGIGTFIVNKNFNLKGNVMSMLFGDAGKDNYSLSSKNYAFYKLFYNCTTLKSVSANFLPATTLSNSCYTYMFYKCTSLTTAPELPATTLTNCCYQYMFNSCTSLTTAPELPATTLATYCYAYMFNNCTSLTTAPELPATTLADSCYSRMFGGCYSLIVAPTLPATTLASYCYYEMFYDCTSLTEAPELPATTLVEHCYSNMFKYCTKLNYIKMLATDISADNCLYNWVKGVASSGTFVKHPDMTSLPTGTSGIPSGWTVVDA